MDKHIVVVLGMHRSGTSAITRGLSVIGIDLGLNLIEGISGDNEKGFFEDGDVNVFNNEFLKALGHDWHSLTPVLQEELTGPLAQSFKARAVTLLRTKLRSTDLFGLKEPRIARLLPFWQDVFEHFQARVSYVIACRNPLSVSQSLAKRDGFEPVKSYYLWLEYMLSSISHTTGKNRIVVDYDNMMEDPARQLKRIADCLGLNFDPATREFSEYKNEFLEGSLRHTRFTAEDLDQVEAVPKNVIELYHALQQLAADRRGFDELQLMSLLNRIQEQLHEIHPALTYMRYCDEKVTNLNQAAAQRDQQLAQRDQQLAQRDQQLAQRDQQLAQRDQQLAQRDQLLAQMDGQIISSKQEVVQLFTQISNFHEQLNIVSAQLDGIITSKSWILTRPLRYMHLNLFTKPIRLIQNKLYSYIEFIWRNLPLSTLQKKRLMSFLFQKLSFFLSKTQTYQIWQRENPSVPIQIDQSISGKVFNSAYYLAANPDIATAGIDPLHHYCTNGWREGRNPHPLFNVAYYMQRYPDVKKAGMNPLEHYLLAGWKEGRDPHPVFDATYFSSTGWYSKDCGISPLEYYLRFRCAAPAMQLAGLDTLLPRQKDSSSASRFAQIHPAKPEVSPLISILMPTYNTPAMYLEATIASVLAQCYGNWQLCVTDDGSVSTETREVLERYSLLDPRIQIQWLDSNIGISAATNEALSRARGEFVAMLDHDDTLEPDALLEFVRELNAHPDTDAIYSDQDLITTDGELVSTFYKPDWSPEMMRGVMYVGHLLLVRRSLALEINGFDSRFDRVQDFEFMLRIGEYTDRIRHIPKILYHWRMIPGSIAHDGDAKGKVEPLQCAAVNAHLERLGLAGQATPHPLHAHRAWITPLPGTAPPSITVIIGQTSTLKHLQGCLDSLIGIGPKLEVLLLTDSGVPISRPGVRVLSVPPNNASVDNTLRATQLINMALQEARGEFVLFMESPIKLSPGWAERLALYAGRPSVMLVAPQVLNVNGTVAAAGLILHPRLGVEPAMSCWNPDSDGLAGSLSCAREVSAVSAACVCFRHSLVQQIGGFDPLYRIAMFQMADASLKAMSLGLTNIYVPTVTATHYEPPPKASPDDECLDRGLFMDRWSKFLQDGDRYHNPNYKPDNGGYVPFKSADITFSVQD